MHRKVCEDFDFDFAREEKSRVKSSAFVEPRGEMVEIDPALVAPQRKTSGNKSRVSSLGLHILAFSHIVLELIFTQSTCMLN